MLKTELQFETLAFYLGNVTNSEYVHVHQHKLSIELNR
jgi:hypothetical protein